MKTKIAMGIMDAVPVEHTKQLRIYKEAGIDGFFSVQYRSSSEELKKAADELGLIYQSIHADFGKMRDMWYESETTKTAVQELKDCIDDCVKCNVPIVVMHPFIGFDVNEANEVGIKNFKEVVDYAKEKGIKVAFENVEGEAYLEALMNEFKTYDNVGFCWDTGHEMCYNRGKDMLALYGDRLIATHINDNIGVTGEDITFLDDLHLLPFDGIKDWQDAMARLDKCGFADIMTFEFAIREGVTKYSDMRFEEYVEKVYEKAQKLISMRA